MLKNHKKYSVLIIRFQKFVKSKFEMCLFALDLSLKDCLSNVPPLLTFLIIFFSLRIHSQKLQKMKN